MPCGGVISEPCGFIELPAWYQPKLDCKWKISEDVGKEISYQVDSLEVGSKINN